MWYNAPMLSDLCGIDGPQNQVYLLPWSRAFSQWLPLFRWVKRSQIFINFLCFCPIFIVINVIKWNVYLLLKKCEIGYFWLKIRIHETSSNSNIFIKSNIFIYIDICHVWLVFHIEVRFFRSIKMYFFHYRLPYLHASISSKSDELTSPMWPVLENGVKFWKKKENNTASWPFWIQPQHERTDCSIITAFTLSPSSRGSTPEALTRLFLPM